MFSILISGTPFFLFFSVFQFCFKDFFVLSYFRFFLNSFFLSFFIPIFFCVLFVDNSQRSFLFGQLSSLSFFVLHFLFLCLLFLFVQICHSFGIYSLSLLSFLYVFFLSFFLSFLLRVNTFEIIPSLVFLSYAFFSLSAFLSVLLFYFSLFNCLFFICLSSIYSYLSVILSLIILCCYFCLFLFSCLFSVFNYCVLYLLFCCLFNSSFSSVFSLLFLFLFCFSLPLFYLFFGSLNFLPSSF
ncbi:unnamed protein product [Acanthosepion pharaonis]|uniref:Uncharacterized protein n=1 Tax=Acanthosepion pharaonis TaxID=158019 RepID=A0A812D7X4_ACAPH|nr:unnamed protein product [Sepia pharaonis]